jgi:DNA-binding transcriptional LysR family regulator
LQTAGLGIVLAEFAEKYPSISLLLREGHSSNLLQLIGRGELDACILVVRPSSYPMPDKLRYLRMHIYEATFVVARNHRLAGRSDVRFADLEHERFVVPTGQACTSLKEALAGAGISEYSVFETNDSDMVISLVAQGVGIGLAPDFRVDRAGLGLSTFTAAEFTLPSELALAWGIADEDDPILSTFIEYIGSQNWPAVLHIR